MMMQHATSRSRSRRRGFTLVEALVAIIILLIGVAAAIRIFPRGFAFLSRTEQVAAGRDLVNTLKSELFTHRDYLPDAIYPADGPQVSLQNFQFSDLSAIFVDPNTTSAYRQYLFPSTPGVWPLAEPLSARVLRRVVGERCQIPSEFNAQSYTDTSGQPAVARYGFIPQYLPRFAPLEAGATLPIIIYDLRYRRVGSGELTQLGRMPPNSRTSSITPSITRREPFRCCPALCPATSG